MKVKPTTIDEYLATLPTAPKAALERLRLQIRAVVPDVVETISYGIPMFKLHGKLLVGFAAYSKYVSFITASGSTIEAHQDVTAAYDTTKSSIRFAFNETLPDNLINLLVMARVSENEASYKLKDSDNVTKTT